MNKIYPYLVFILALTFSNCTKDLEDLNVNPNASTTVVPGYMFTKAQLDAVSNNYIGAAYLTIGGSMQQTATYKEVPAAGDKYFNETYSYTSWEAYSTAVIEIQKVMDAVAEDPEQTNLLSIARIWKVFIFHRLTDLYGDIPYFESGLGLNGTYSPKYDEQSVVYADLLKELDEAAVALNADLPSYGNADLIYGGDIAKWRKFAYSLMLRLGMRLTNVDIAAAESWVRKAIEGGVVLADVDLARIAYVDGSQISQRNFIASGLLNTDYLNQQAVDNIEGGKLAETFINHLKNTNDPRLNVISVVRVRNATGTFVPDTTSSLQMGMPNARYNSFPENFATFSEPNPNTILRFDAPHLVLTPTEMYTLLAEASLRGWYDTDAAELYTQAVQSAMRQWALFGSYAEIAQNRIDFYLSGNPFASSGTFEDKLEQLYTHLWVSLFLQDEYEIFANWRRTGYPILTPVNYPGNLTGGTVPRRFVVPLTEENYNGENFREAVQRQGGTNALTSRVWWDQ
ncbi:SusD/RagB family nutrient-binding outer membrane lipoprotein [Olivibacter sp. SDN3]|uniref:SusD/RagB family nutrient-binding outer membrane lipoprotein n=1 Tax=Olivibacter sp. SDN3 TaxID=2764720 RepID=UPI0016514FA7|nr:SusD/RagB family nutrient-binding outer membrane lipoprotein [Olivibacter sp. SDN3]QNL50761.1 SusD/RagB family nutrient-binding outer membrane lipoprotein [Olivibacter sp. SDN3]